MKALQVGDVVIEKGNNVPMTICRIEQDIIHCQWFVGSELNERLFKESELTKSAE